VIAYDHKTPVASVPVAEGVPAPATPGGLDGSSGAILFPCVNEPFDLEGKLW
jgi:hypothetical protein